MAAREAAAKFIQSSSMVFIVCHQGPHHTQIRRVNSVIHEVGSSEAGKIGDDFAEATGFEGEDRWGVDFVY